MYYDAFTECTPPYSKGELTFFCEAFFQIIHRAQSDIIADLSEKKHKMRQLSNMMTDIIESVELSPESQDILFILGQNYIFGIEGKGMTKGELIHATEKIKYIVGKALAELSERNFITFLKKRPIEVRLSGVLCKELD